jgi:hypothetical protein
MKLTDLKTDLKYKEYPSPSFSSFFIKEPKSLKEGKCPFGFDFSETKENEIIITTNNLTNRIEEHKPEKPGVQEKKSISIDEINQLSTFDEIVKYGINAVKLKGDYLFNRIYELKELCDEEEDCDLSLESLKSMLWKNTLNNLRLIVQPLLLFWLIYPWLDIFPNSYLLLGFNQLIDAVNGFLAFYSSGYYYLLNLESDRRGLQN